MGVVRSVWGQGRHPAFEGSGERRRQLGFGIDLSLSSNSCNGLRKRNVLGFCRRHARFIGGIGGGGNATETLTRTSLAVKIERTFWLQNARAEG